MRKVEGKKFISDLKLYSDYLKWDKEKERYETWKEACDKVLKTHYSRYGNKINGLIDEIKNSYYNKEFLSSQRNLQFRGDSILKHNAKLYNCCTTYIYSPDCFSKGFYILLCGSGLGISLKKKFTKHMPPIQQRGEKAILYNIEDSIEGWAEAVKVLVSSYCEHPSLYKEYLGYNIKFNYSNIREKGAFISGGFKAPGPEGLKSSIERIDKLLSDSVGEFKSIVIYDIFMHLSDAVLSGGVRRSAMSVILDYDDKDMVNAKTGSWRQDSPWRARSNNSVGLIRNEFTKKEFQDLLALNRGDNDMGFVFMNNEDEIFNPCFEIGFNFYNQIENRDETAFQFCNLNELNASACVNSKNEFSEKKFYDLCRKSSILGTLQAGYYNFPYLGKQTEDIVSGESLLGISITGWMCRSELFNDEILKKGAEIVKKTNEEVAEIIGINPAARTTTVKPSGNASVILQTSSGIHPEHSKRYFRIMQINKESEVAKYLEKNIPSLLEDSKWSSTNSDYVVYVPCENNDNVIVKEELQGIKHLKKIKQVQNSWIKYGKNESYCYNKDTQHNVSNTVIIDNFNDIVDYIYENQDYFTAVSFIDFFGDKEYVQAPFTSVLNTDEIVKEYGFGSLFASGLITDGLHYFNNDLWNALSYVKQRDYSLDGSNENKILQKNWISRVKKFSKNYFNNDIDKTIYCMKDVHLFHKWNVINRNLKNIDFTKVLKKPEFNDIDKYGAISCSGGSCDVV